MPTCPPSYRSVSGCFTVKIKRNIMIQKKVKKRHIHGGSSATWGKVKNPARQRGAKLGSRHNWPPGADKTAYCQRLTPNPYLEARHTLGTSDDKLAETERSGLTHSFEKKPEKGGDHLSPAAARGPPGERPQVSGISPLRPEGMPSATRPCRK